MFSRTFQKHLLKIHRRPYQIVLFQERKIVYSSWLNTSCSLPLTHVRTNCSYNYNLKSEIYGPNYLYSGFHHIRKYLNVFSQRKRNICSLENKGQAEEDYDDEIKKYRTKSGRINGCVHLFNFKEKLDSKCITEMSQDDWSKLESDVLNENTKFSVFWEAACMNFICGLKSIDLGLSLSDYIKNQGRSLNIATTTALMSLLGKDARLEHQQQIMDLYKQLLELTDGLLDSHSIKHVITGLSGTDNWKECFNLLSMLELSQPSLPKYYTPIILAALHCGDITSTMLLLHKMGAAGLDPENKVYQAFLQTCKTNSKLSIDVLFKLMEEHRWFPSKEVMSDIVQHVKRNGNMECWSEAWVRIDKRGVCPNCSHRLERLDIPARQFRKLRSKFLEKVLIGKDIYQKSNPLELEQFKTFVEENAPFDVVLDSLNVAFNTGQKQNKSVQLRKVVEYFALDRKMKVLVIGRKHMKFWPKTDMSIILKHASYFLIENISEDDPFLLYATIYSGPHTIFVSSDEMRDHKFNLGDLGEIFRKWQHSHQVQLSKFTKSGHVFFEWPRKEDVRAQRCADGWHIPFDNHEERSSWQYPYTWLCLRHHS